MQGTLLRRVNNVVHNRRLFLVFALHRSGSSATAGILHYLGADMGQNEGLFENLDFVAINDEILWAASGSWDRPPSPQAITNVGFPPERIENFLSKYARPVWGLKDPRFLLTFDLWKTHFSGMHNITFVFVHRPFISSVRSLAFRDNFSVTQAAEIQAPYLENFYRHRYFLAAQGADVIDVHYDRLVDDVRPFVADVNLRLNTSPEQHLDRVQQWIIKDLKRF